MVIRDGAGACFVMPPRKSTHERKRSKVNALTSVMSEIFDRNVEHRFESAEEERAAIQAAKGGDSDAMVALMRAYAPAIRNAVSKFTGPDSTAHDREELRSAVVLGFVEAVNAYDSATADRLAGLIKDVLARTLREEFLTPTAFAVPDRTLTRFYAILRQADGNVYEAAALAPSYEMKSATFLAVLSAVRNVNSLDQYPHGPDGEEAPIHASAVPLWDNAVAEEDADLVAAAFAAVDSLEEVVCRLAYAFTDYDPVPDAEIGDRLGFSRAKAQRIRAGALGKMREALAVA